MTNQAQATATTPNLVMLGIDYRKQRPRRKLVAYLGVAVSFTLILGWVRFYVSSQLYWNCALALMLVVYGFVILGSMPLHRFMTGYRGGKRGADERQAAVVDSAHRIAYTWLALFVSAFLLYQCAALSPAFPHKFLKPWSPQQGDDMFMPVLTALAVISDLPSAILAWREPNWIEEE